MAFSDIITNGSGRARYVLEITGIPYLFATEDFVPDIQTTKGYTDTYQWLDYNGITVEQRASFIEGTCQVEPISLTIKDIDGGFTALIRDFKAYNNTVLFSTLSDSATTVTVESTSSFPSSGYIWIEQEAIQYTGKTSTTFTGCTRGRYGTQAREHKVDLDLSPIIRAPFVLDGPEFLLGRRANVYACDNTSTATTAIFRGFIAGDIQAGQGVWRLSLEHIMRLFSRSTLTGLPKTKITNCYYYSGFFASATYQNLVSGANIVETSSTGSTISADVVLTEGLYKSTYELAAQWAVDAMSTYSTAGFTHFPTISISDSGRFCIQIATNNNSYGYTINVRYGDPFWSAGFNPGTYVIPVNSVTSPFVIEAQNEPRHCFIEMRKSPSVAVDSVEGFTASSYIVVKGYPAIKITTVDTTNIELDLSTASRDLRYNNLLADDDNIYIEKESDAEIIQAYKFTDDSITDLMKEFFGLGLGRIDNDRIIKGLESTDIDWTELDAALQGSPAQLRACYGIIKEDRRFDELFCDQLGLMGIVPRLTTDGKIGFIDAKVPDTLHANLLEVDSSMWAYMYASGITTQVEGRERINEVVVQFNEQYFKSDELPRARGKENIVISYFDGINTLGKTVRKTYDCPLLSVAESPSWIAKTELELALAVKRRVSGIHFGIFGRLSPVVRIPVVWKSKAYKIGDIVRVEHPALVDVNQGFVGVSNRLGLIVGMMNLYTDKGPDFIDVLFPPRENVSSIAPCARATSWSSGTLTLTFAATNLFNQPGDTDLTYFLVGHEVAFTQTDTTTPKSWGTSTIVSKTASTVTLDSDPFAALGFNSCFMHFDTWDNVPYGQQRYLYQGDGNYTLGSSPVEAYVWGS